VLSYHLVFPVCLNFLYFFAPFYCQVSALLGSFVLLRPLPLLGFEMPVLARLAGHYMQEEVGRSEGWRATAHLLLSKEKVVSFLIIVLAAVYAQLFVLQLKAEFPAMDLSKLGDLDFALDPVREVLGLDPSSDFLGVFSEYSVNAPKCEHQLSFDFDSKCPVLEKLGSLHLSLLTCLKCIYFCRTAYP
jgi:hypothetical protein